MFLDTTYLSTLGLPIQSHCLGITDQLKKSGLSMKVVTNKVVTNKVVTNKAVTNKAVTNKAVTNKAVTNKVVTNKGCPVFGHIHCVRQS